MKYKTSLLQTSCVDKISPIKRDKYSQERSQDTSHRSPFDTTEQSFDFLRFAGARKDRDRVGVEIRMFRVSSSAFTLCVLVRYLIPFLFWFVDSAWFSVMIYFSTLFMSSLLLSPGFLGTATADESAKVSNASSSNSASPHLKSTADF